ncbi:phage tail spike protein [Paenibacillus larvae]
MYKVSLINDGLETVIHSPHVDDLKLSSGMINLGLNQIDSFTFSINLGNPGYGKIKPLRTLVKVKDTKRNKIIFDGRVLKPQSSMSDSCMFSGAYICESKMGYLQDSAQRHAEIHDTSIRDFFQIMINNHNRSVEPYKRFQVGEVTVINTTDNVYRYLSYDRTFPTIKDKLIDREGGYLRIREDGGTTYIDYLAEIGEVKATQIRIAKNLKSISKEVNPTEVITRLVPLGETIQSEDETATDASPPRLTIAEVNGGIDYLDDPEMQKEFGIIEGSVTWDNVTEPSVLLSKGRDYLKNQKAARVTYTISAYDLSLIGLDVNSFEVGNWHPVVNPVLGIIDEPLQIIEKQIDINSPQNAALTIGQKYRTLSQYQAETNKARKSVVNLRDTIASQTEKVIALNESLSAAQKTIKELQQTVNNADLGNLQPTLDAINTQLGKLAEKINAIGAEIPADLAANLKQIQSNLTTLKTFKKNQDLLNADFENRLTKLEGGK